MNERLLWVWISHQNIALSPAYNANLILNTVGGKFAVLGALNSFHKFSQKYAKIVEGVQVIIMQSTGVKNSGQIKFPI